MKVDQGHKPMSPIIEKILKKRNLNLKTKLESHWAKGFYIRHLERVLFLIMKVREMRLEFRLILIMQALNGL